MRTDTGKVLGIGVLFVAVLLAMVTTIAVTNFTILDTDPTTYVIVVMLMLFALIVFSLKENLTLNRDGMQIFYGALIFAGYILLLSYLRASLSFVYTTFGVGALLVPVAILSFTVMLFGFGGVRKLWPVIIYALFASPLLLMPVLWQAGGFANANAYFVYGAMRAFGIPVTINGITITSQASTSISIAATCAPIGTFIALVMFLVPIAYLFNGKRSRKALWVLFGFALLLLLNFGRMFLIAYSWSYYGITQAVAVFHIFAGQILFYAVIVAMLLLAGKCGLRMPRLRKNQLRDLRKDIRKRGVGFNRACAVTLSLGVVALLFSMPYINSMYASPTFFYSAIGASGAQTLYQMAGKSIGYIYPKALALGENGTSYAFAIENSTSSATYIIALAVPIPSQGPIEAGTSPVVGQGRYLLKSGVSVGAGIASAGNYTFELNYFALPFNVSGSYASVNYEFLSPLNTSIPSCGYIGYQSIGLFNYIESSIYNTINGNFNYNAGGFLCSTYLVAQYG